MSQENEELIKSNSKNLKSEFKSEGTQNYECLKFISENPVSTDLAREQANNKLNILQKSIKNTNFFNSLKNDLTLIIKENRVRILTHTIVSSNKIIPTRHKTDQVINQNDIKWDFNFKINNKKKIKTIAKLIKIEEMTEEYYYAIQKQIMTNFIKYDDNLNKIEIREIIKLDKKVNEILDQKQDLTHPDYLIAMDVFINKQQAEFQINLNNDYVNDWIQRRSLVQGTFEFDLNIIINEDMDLIIERKDVLIPKFMNLKQSTDKDGKTISVLTFSRKYNGINFAKNITIDPYSLDLFQLYKIVINIVDFLNEKLAELELFQLKEKLITIKEILNNLDN